MSSRHEKEKGVNVQVLLRCRPFSEEEVRSNAPQVVTCNESQREVSVSQNVAGKHFDRVFTFDKVFGPSAQQKDLYDLAVIPIVNEVLEGFNCTIFAYGQTGTGKTYTMEGECKRSKTGPNGELPAEAGVIPRAVKQIFDTLESQNAEYSVKVTFLELYNEEITDLLAPEELSKVSLDDKQRKQLPLMEDGKGGVLVRGLEEEIVTSANEIFTLLERGSAKRRTAETLLNKQSSRSHSLFSITMHIKEPTPEGEELIKCGKLNLVDLAGSENISRSGAREGRAREAGEINKSLLTLGRVINALVEHVGHIPYRDSKLTRLLRDSLGGRTKTCIIATVSPAVHCLEETLSTLDYAHRAKNIKNKPEVNQKMMKSTLIKDLYGEIERLKADVYAAREKNGVYLPKERYLQEEGEKKAMAEQIQLLGVSIENYQKQVEELQKKYDEQVQKCSELSCRIDATEMSLNTTRNSLRCAEEELKKCRYALKEKDFIISEQKISESAIAQQASSLRADLEKAILDNDLLHKKIGREDKLIAGNRQLVSNFKAELFDQVGSLRDIVASTVSQQTDNLDSIKRLCQSFLTQHNQSLMDMKNKLEASSSFYSSHSETLRNVVLLNKSNSVASLEEISSAASSSFKFLQELLVREDDHASSIFNDLKSTLLLHQEEMAAFSSDLREKFRRSSVETKNTSEYIHGFLQKLSDSSAVLENYASETEDAQMKRIADFHRVYEEQSNQNAEKLAAEISSLISGHIRKQKELVDARLIDFRIHAAAGKSFLQEHARSVSGVAADAKRKWREFSSEAENRSVDGGEYAAAKHCRMEKLLKQCGSEVDSAAEHWKRTVESVGDAGCSHEAALVSLIRNASDSAALHAAEVTSAAESADEELGNGNRSILRQIESASHHGGKLVSDVLSSVRDHEATIKKFVSGHSAGAAAILRNSEETLGNRYMDYEASGSTPVKCAAEVPSTAAIEALKAAPKEKMVKEFREKNAYEVFETKEMRGTLTCRSPLSPLN